MAKMVDYLLYTGNNWSDIKKFWEVKPSDNLILCTLNAPVGWYIIKTDDGRYDWIPPKDLEIIKKNGSVIC
jgi:hypothetical protein